MNGVLDLAVTIAGLSISGSKITRAYDSGEGYGPWTIPAAVAGSLTTRGGDDSGVITFTSAHGLLVDDLIDIYWAAGVRYWSLVTVVDELVVTFTDTLANDSGGDVMPAQDTAVLADERIEKPVSFDGDDMVELALWMKKRGHFELLDVADASLWAQELPANELLPWVDTWPYTRPITGNAAAKVRYSNGVAENSEFRFGVLTGSVL